MTALQAPQPTTWLPNALEFVIQKNCAAHFDWHLSPGWLWTHYPSGEDRDKRVGAKLKVMGAKTGWPDCIFVSPEGLIHCLELKRASEFRGRDNGLSEAQIVFRDHALKQGWPWAIAADFNTAVAIVRGWGAIRQ